MLGPLPVELSVSDAERPGPDEMSGFRCHALVPLHLLLAPSHRRYMVVIEVWAAAFIPVVP